MATTKMRSPNYPQFSLPDSIEFIRALWNKEKTTSVSSLVASKALGYSSESGNSKAKIAAMKKFGLLDSSKDGVKVSRLAMRIIHQPLDHADRAAAIREAALKPELFTELAQSHIEASDEALRSHLMVHKDFGDLGAKQCAEAFRSTMTFAKLGTESHEIDLNQDQLEAESQDTSGPTPNSSLNTSPQKTVTIHQSPTGSGVGQVRATYSWPLSKGVVAELRFTGGNVEPEHLERLRQYLELAKDALSDSGIDPTE